MKTGKVFAFLIGLILVSDLYAQVGVNTTTPKATLDVQIKNGSASSDPEGIIAPRIKLSDLKSRDSAYQNEQTGAIVYVTETSGGTTPKTARIITPGYYYFDGSQWSAFSSGTEIWNEVGTTNPSGSNKTNSYLNAKVVIGDKPSNNSFNPSTDLSPADVNDGTAQLTVIGQDAVINGITVGTGKTQGTGLWSTNTALGLSTLSKNTADDNTALGKWALAENVTGEKNTAIGSNANNINGPDNIFHKTVAVGNDTKANKDGAIAIGSGTEALSIASISIGSDAINALPQTTFIKNQSTIIGNSMPTQANATLQVIGEPRDSAKADGLMVPMVKRSELQAKESNSPQTYGTNQKGTLVYVTEIDGANPATDSQTEQITDEGHYYFEPNIGSSGQWIKLSMGMRHEFVHINSAWINNPTTGYYNNLQEAYTMEAQKMYNPVNGGVVNFICHGSGDLGNLLANGEIPYLYLTVENSDPVTLGELEFNNMRAVFYTPANTNFRIKTKKIKASGANITLTKEAKIQSSGGIELTQSTFFTMGTDTGNNYISTDYIAASNSLVYIKNCDMEFIANKGVTNPDACISCTQSSYVELGENTTVNLNRPVIVAALYAKTSGALKLYASTVNILQAFTYDLHVVSSGSLVIDGKTTIKGSAQSNSFLNVNSLGKVSIISSSITRTGLLNNGFESTDGGMIVINADGTTAFVAPKDTNENMGFYANGGEILVVGGNSKNINISNFNQYVCLWAIGGGVIKTNGKVNHSRASGFSGVISDSGAVIYDGN